MARGRVGKGRSFWGERIGEWAEKGKGREGESVGTDGRKRQKYIGKVRGIGGIDGRERELIEGI